MPLDPIIARGVAPIDVSNSLYRIAQLSLADREEQRRARTNDLLERRYDEQQKAAASLTEKQQALAKVEWALASPSPAQAILDDPEAVTAFTQSGLDLAGLDDERARQLLMQARGAMASELGQGPPAAEKPETMRVGDEIVRVGPEGVTPLYRGKSNFAPQRPEAAPAEQRFAEWYMQQTPENQTKIDRALEAKRARSETQPRIIPDPFGGDPSLIEQGPDGGYVRKPIPMVGSGPTDIRAQAFEEARAAIATGRITKEQAAERLRNAGIDPTGL